MPAPKKFTPAPTTPQSYTPVRSSETAKGRYAVVPPVPKPRVDEEEESVEVTVDEVTVVMEKASKYEQRALNVHVDPRLTIDLDEVDESPQPVEPVRPAAAVLGEWRTESSLDGTRYRRKDTRRP